MAEGEIRTWEEFEKACSLIGVTLDQCIAATLSTNVEEDPTEAELAEDCLTVYAMLDEVEEQLNEAAGEVDLDKDEDILRLIEDFKACKRVRKLIKELLDPQHVPAQAADIDPDGS
jgi:hypothetical protein